MDCDIANFSSESLKKLHDVIMPCACETKEEELFEIISHVESDENPLYFAKMIPQTLKKLAHKKNRETFYDWAKRIDELKFADSARRDEINSLIGEKVNEVKKNSGDSVQHVRRIVAPDNLKL
ncbi:hypothetical protein [Treponema zioleckii]|uniref:hypothetical protein n=1 Tax=Treponema zioleckii TaxID=331680 RepID=UPI00168C0AA8|nr:hypothetical protein [Treponema zioleckii]